MHRKKETTVVSVMCVPYTQRPSCTFHPLLALAKQEAMWWQWPTLRSTSHAWPPLESTDSTNGEKCFTSRHLWLSKYLRQKSQVSDHTLSLSVPPSKPFRWLRSLTEWEPIQCNQLIAQSPSRKAFARNQPFVPVFAQRMLTKHLLCARDIKYWLNFPMIITVEWSWTTLFPAFISKRICLLPLKIMSAFLFRIKYAYLWCCSDLSKNKSGLEINPRSPSVLDYIPPVSSHSNCASLSSVQSPHPTLWHITVLYLSVAQSL